METGLENYLLWSDGLMIIAKMRVLISPLKLFRCLKLKRPMQAITSLGIKLGVGKLSN
jgi:hypothetical protein